MNQQQLEDATKLALSKQEINDSLDVFDGFGLHGFKPVYVTISQVARLIRWQCFQLNGGIDGEALQEIADAGIRRHKFRILDS